MRRLALALLLVLLIVSPGVAANTITVSDKVITVVPDGTTDWDSTDRAPKGMEIYAITFVPSAVNDKVSIRNGGATAALMFPNVADVLGGGLVQYYGPGRFVPYLKASECTFGTAANVRIIIQLR